METSDQLCQRIAAETDTVILAFSCGKDSIASWIQLNRHFKHVLPYYMYLVPDLEFVEDSLKYFEDYFGAAIARYPHPSIYRWLNNLIFQAPENCRFIEAARLPPYDFDDLYRIIRHNFNLPDGWIAQGVRQNDSIVRRLSIQKHGAANQKTRTFFPVFDWDKARLLAELRGSGVKMPKDYWLFGRSFDGLDYRFLKPIKDHLPKDYQKIIDWFPLAELDIMRREWREDHHAKH